MSTHDTRKMAALLERADSPDQATAGRARVRRWAARVAQNCFGTSSHRAGCEEDANSKIQSRISGRALPWNTMLTSMLLIGTAWTALIAVGLARSVADNNGSLRIVDATGTLESGALVLKKSTRNEVGQLFGNPIREYKETGDWPSGALLTVAWFKYQRNWLLPVPSYVCATFFDDVLVGLGREPLLADEPVHRAPFMCDKAAK